MKEKRWFAAFIITVLVILAAIAGLNASVDPFGVFGDRIYDWYSYDFTQNPRASKVAWLNTHGDEFDGFIIGASGSAALSTERAEKYLGGSFYHCFAYGMDLYESEGMTRLAIEEMGAKNIILSIGVESPHAYALPKSDLNNHLHYKISGKSPVPFYFKYLYANPKYAVEKIKSAKIDTYLPQTFDVFTEETGRYDKSARDAESFGNYEEYWDLYPQFGVYASGDHPLPYIDECMESLRRIVAMCDDAGVGLTVIVPPIFAYDVVGYDPEEVRSLFTQMAEITDFWDFTVSSISLDSRYFYDVTHFRNAVGDMMLARIFDDGSVYTPDDFGHLVSSREDAFEAAQRFFSPGEPDVSAYSQELPIILYHHLVEDGEINNDTMYADTFRSHMIAIREAGYETVSPQQIIDYVNLGAPLPDNPIWITFDDGYYSNYEYAFPILQELDMQATMFIIGVSTGKDTYKDKGVPITPHFGSGEIAEMVSSGLISIGSHGYDMHQVQDYDGKDCREGVLQMKNEPEAEYIDSFIRDLELSAEQITGAAGIPPSCLAYPYGLYDQLTETLSVQQGFQITLSTRYDISTVVKGLPQTLLAMKRLSINEMSADALLELIDGFKS